MSLEQAVTLDDGNAVAGLQLSGGSTLAGAAPRWRTVPTRCPALPRQAATQHRVDRWDGGEMGRAAVSTLSKNVLGLNRPAMVVGPPASSGERV